MQKPDFCECVETRYFSFFGNNLRCKEIDKKIETLFCRHS